ncbi:hypothetical protein JHD50_06935 [Sulfurimonas sp. MAG313]|nr:hypothetical protein [Sulfurimonas sp. MAG313]MDF1881041.1 hypothetical protein [Sulfurimonas sp. MAG313]
MKKQKIILVGASTGGPGHLSKFFTALRSDVDAIMPKVAQELKACSQVLGLNAIIVALYTF